MAAQVAALAVLEVELNESMNIVDALVCIPTEAACSILSLISKSGHLTVDLVKNLIRCDTSKLDLSGATAPSLIRRGFDDAGDDDCGTGGSGSGVHPFGSIASLPPMAIMLGPALTSLREVNLSDASMELLSDFDVRSLAEGCQRLETLALRGLQRLTDETISAALNANAATLRRLDVSNCSGLSDAAFAPLSEASCRLVELRVGCVLGFTEQALVEALGSGTSAATLRTLDIKSTGVCDFAAKPSLFPSLTSLNAKGLSSLTGPAWRSLLGPSETAAARFQVLKLGECEVTTDVIRRLLPTAGDSTLRDLDLSWVESCSGSAAVSLACAAGPSLLSLKLRCVALDDGDDDGGGDYGGENSGSDGGEATGGLNLSGGESRSSGMVGIPALVSLGHRCSSLTSLNLSRCGDRVAACEALAALASGCPELRDLDVGWTGADDGGVRSILAACGRLERLGLQGCKRLTAAVVDAMAAHPGLLWCDLSWVNAMDTSIVKALVTRNRRLLVVDYYGEDISGAESRLVPEAMG